MNKAKHLIVLFCITFLFTALVYFLPRQSDLLSRFSFLEKKTAPIVDSAITPIDTVPYIVKLQSALPLVKALYSEKRNKYFWTLGKGKAIPVYLLQIQKHIQSYGGKVIHMEELFLPNAFQSATLTFSSALGDTSTIELQISENIFGDSVSKMAIAFEVEKLSPELIVQLNALDFPYSVLVTPFGTTDHFFYDIDKLKNAETILWLYMESEKLRNSHYSKNPIRIHHTEQKIEEIIESAKKKLPYTKGVATRYGEKAVEHRNLLNAIFKSLQKQELWFLDLTDNRTSLVSYICKNYALKCKEASAYSEETSTIEDYIARNLRLASRRGTSYLILPLSLKTLSKIQDLKEKASTQGTEITTLSNVINVRK